MARREKGAAKAVEDAGGNVRDLFPDRTREDELHQYIMEVPEQHRELVLEVARKYANTTHRAMAAAAGALIAEELYEPNSSYGLFAHTDITAGTTLARGASATAGHIYSLTSYLGGVAQSGSGIVGGDGVTFVKGQRFFGLMTGPQDSNAGWTFVGNSVKIQTDAISGIETDTSFAIFRPEIVRARMIKGEYEGFEITSLTVIPFVAQAYLPVGGSTAPMLEGLSVMFWDSRCLNKELGWLDMDTMSYDGMVRELVERADAGRITKKLLAEYVPAHRRRRRLA